MHGYLEGEMKKTHCDPNLDKTVLEGLRRVYESLRDNMQKKYQRDLPLEELLFDRWERAKTMGFGNGTSIYHNSYVYGHVEVGEKTWIGPFTILDGTGGLKIGSNCSISAGVQIYTHDSVKWAITGGAAPYEYGSVIISDRCYIGPYTVISKGVTIGPESVVGAYSLILSDIPAGSKVYGCPAKIKRDRDDGLQTKL